MLAGKNLEGSWDMFTEDGELLFSATHRVQFPEELHDLAPVFLVKGLVGPTRAGIGRKSRIVVPGAPTVRIVDHNITSCDSTGEHEQPPTGYAFPLPYFLWARPEEGHTQKEVDASGWFDRRTPNFEKLAAEDKGFALKAKQLAARPV